MPQEIPFTTCGVFCLHETMVMLQVDKHIRRLDGDLARFEAEIHFKETAGRRASMSGVCIYLCSCIYMLNGLYEVRYAYHKI